MSTSSTATSTPTVVPTASTSGISSPHHPSRRSTESSPSPPPSLAQHQQVSFLSSPAGSNELKQALFEYDEKLGSNGKGNKSGTSTSPSPRSIPAWFIVGVWICLSTAVILYNREIMMGSAKFQYPITLTTLHLTYQTIATRLLHRYTNLIAGVSKADYAAVPQHDVESASPDQTSRQQLDSAAKDAAVHVSWDDWWRQIVPPAIMFSLSLVLSNWAYLYLTTAFIHMLKAVSPVAILLAAFAFRTKAFSPKLLFIVVIISSGVGMASFGEASFNMTGFLIQMTAIAIEAIRVTLIQILLQGDSMSPLKSLYLFAPICLVINASLILPVEGFAAIRAIPELGFWTIFANASLTMALNLSAIYLIGISSMVLSLSKVAKDVIMVGGSAVLLGDQLTMLQAVGYSIATAGMLYYKTQ